ncbi:MAG: ABC transporter ATP-binding protein [Candidatus Micrarchaeota archaeon]
MDEIISLKDITKIYSTDGQFVALSEVSLSVKKGEFLIIMGRSGCGKSTLLHIMSCLDSPTKGDVYVCGVKTNGLAENEIAKIRREGFGFVFQAFNLIPNLDALRNVALPMMFDGVEKTEREEKAKQLLEEMDLGKKIYNFPNEMSGGEKQRVAIARALANNPEIIVADEPTGNLDSLSAKHVLEIFDNLHKKQKKTLIVVTHEQYVAELGERTIFMKDGKIENNEKIKGKIK